MPAVALLIPSSLGLDYEHIHCKQEEWNPVDSIETSWRLRLCWWCRIALTHPTSNAGKYHYHQSKFCPHSTGYLFIQWRVRFSRPIQNTTPVVLGDRPLVEVESFTSWSSMFTYLGSNVGKQGGTDADIRIRMGKLEQHSISLERSEDVPFSPQRPSSPSSTQLLNLSYYMVLRPGGQPWPIRRSCKLFLCPRRNDRPK